MNRPSLRLAIDRSVRTTDEDGRLHFAVTNVTKAQVSEYLGSEVVDGDRFGLDPNRMYRLLRDPAELAKAASTFNRLPVLNGHAMATADDPKHDLVVGTTGSDAAFKAPYLQCSMTIWDAAAIEAIQDGSQREISAGYRYDLDLTPGTFEGERYDAVMRNIRGSHIAVVPEGRAGPDVLAADAAPTFTKDDTVDNDTAQKLMDFLQGKLSADDLSAVAQIVSASSDPEPEPEAWDDGYLPDDSQPGRGPTPGASRVGGGPTTQSRAAMDRRVIQKLQAIREAEAEVGPHVGSVLGQDSAAGVYLSALRALGRDTAGLHPTAAKVMFRILTRGGSPRVGVDAAAHDRFAQRFPDAPKPRHLY